MNVNKMTMNDIIVDVFEEIGNWTSPVISSDSLGWGSVDIDGKVPEGTSVIGTILDSLGNPIPGYIDRSLPIHLADINQNGIVILQHLIIYVIIYYMTLLSLKMLEKPYTNN